MVARRPHTHYIMHTAIYITNVSVPDNHTFLNASSDIFNIYIYFHYNVLRR